MDSPRQESLPRANLLQQQPYDRCHTRHLQREASGGENTLSLSVYYHEESTRKETTGVTPVSLWKRRLPFRGIKCTCKVWFTRGKLVSLHQIYIVIVAFSVIGNTQKPSYVQLLHSTYIWKEILRTFCWFFVLSKLKPSIIVWHVDEPSLIDRQPVQAWTSGVIF